MASKTPTALFVLAIGAALLGFAAPKSCGTTGVPAPDPTTTSVTTDTAQPKDMSTNDGPDIGAPDNDTAAQVEVSGDIARPAPLTDREEVILRRVGYTVSYNKDLRLPNWVAWHLTADHLDGPAKRKGEKFTEDTEAPGTRADTYDYQQSGYDRGHMCPAGDNKWSQKAMEESFLMTNICPQAPSLNRGDWNEMEIQCRNWARQYGDIYIVAGPILYNKAHKTIGQHNVTVPEAFFKVVLCMTGTPKGIGFIYKNGDGNRPKGDYVNSIDQVERITGIDFFPELPDDIEQKVEAEANLDNWH